ncbi:hypothetical protein MVEN_00750000 [Mycena venus]|uniref:AB hydrolase-1 domain-containing protein n=1 Tax=Mycena venus TaxID=2733690 RepID=A0A8H6YJG8_9AGAR|nr:hypothetical protein MVEN_00750000 [Mycena venus]
MAYAHTKLFFGWVVLAGLGALFLIKLGCRRLDYAISEKDIVKSEFSWANVVPSDTLGWTECYSAHQCARLNVPLNYSEPDGEKAIIAITRYPAAIPAESPLYRGPVLINPGGPGGSGVDFIAIGGSKLAQIVGPEFDIVGFDPRGKPVLHPLSSVIPILRKVWLTRDHARHSLKRISSVACGGDPSLTDLNASSDSLGRFWARAQVYNRLAGEQGSLQHINTDNTARDMLQIVRAHGEEKIQYWGFSYGSVLGAVFAAMFPEKVERIVIDGVVDAENYFDTLWSNNLLDADKALQTFFDGCAAAGSAGCGFHASTPEAISENLTALYEHVRTRPVPVRTPLCYGLVDFDCLRQTVFDALYGPQLTFSPLADALSALASGDGSLIFGLLESSPPYECSCDPTEHQFDNILDSQMAILCNDGRAVPSGFDEAEKHYQKMVKTSSWGSLIASIRIMCTGWPDIPKRHFQGPVTGNTSFPILVIGNTADPITPLANAKKTSEAFPDSVLLTQDCPGHTSLAAPSPCTQGYIREYFFNGTLPEEDTVCPVLGSPFPDGRFQKQDESEQTVFSAAQRDLFKAFKAAQPRRLVMN